jgi:hypothetical protein
MEPPILDENDTSYEYELKVMNYLRELKRNDYNIILDFINLWLSKYNIKLKSLTNFKFKENFLFSDSNEKYNKKFIKTHATSIKKKLNINRKTVIHFSEYDTDDVPEHEIIHLISILLHKIQYSIVKYNFSYKILDKPKKIICE